MDGLDAEKAQYDELVGAARQLLNDLIGRSLLEGEPVGRIYAAYQLQLANEKIQSAAFLLPLASEGNLLQAFTCSQMNDFRCVRASFDAQRSLTLPVSFYGAVFYKGVEPEGPGEGGPDVREIRVRQRHAAVCGNLNREPEEADAAAGRPRRR